jgi:hypothetical protein
VPETFRGWVNLADSDDPKKLPRESYSTITFNGASVHGSDAWFFDRTTGQSLRYDARSNTIFITRMHPVEMAQTFEGYGRQTFKAVSLDALQSDWQNVGATAQYTVDGKLDRYVVKYPDETQTYWFDPTTRRLAKVQGTNAGNVWTKYYRYNAPAVKSIYDLGVPRTAKIVDNRPTGELKELLARIDQRMDRGFGDYVAILTETPTNDGQLVPNVGSVTLYAQEGTKWLSHRFLAGGRRVVLSRFREEDGPLLPLPDGWPTPDIANLIKPLAAATPNEAYVVDGVNAWWSQYQTDPNGYQEPFYDHGAKYRTNYGTGSNAKALFFLNGLTWGGSDRLELMNAKTGIAMERDPKRPGLICVLADNDHSAFEVWLDPARDDLLVEFIHLRNPGPRRRRDSIGSSRRSRSLPMVGGIPSDGPTRSATYRRRGRMRGPWFTTCRSIRRGGSTRVGSPIRSFG